VSTKQQKVVAVPLAPPRVLDPADLLTLDELAARLKTSKRWVYEKSRKRCVDPLPVFRMGRYLRFSWRDVSYWLQRSGNSASQAAA
jgi:predicted DNA-binding transcriptional regulator AlpA